MWRARPVPSARFMGGREYARRQVARREGRAARSARRLAGGDGCLLGLIGGRRADRSSRGRFAADPVFIGALAGASAVGEPVLCLGEADGVALGAARLFAPDLAPRARRARPRPSLRRSAHDLSRAPATDQIAFFHEHGWLVVEDAIPQADLDDLESALRGASWTEKERLANDWAWDARRAATSRSFRIVQSSPSFVWKEIAEQPYRKWLTALRPRR